jgi:hypothetical protein
MACPSTTVAGRECTARSASTALHSTPLHCTLLHCTALHCTALHRYGIHCTPLHSTALHCTPLHSNPLHCIALHSTAIHYCTALSPLTTPLHSTHQSKHVAGGASAPSPVGARAAGVSGGSAPRCPAARHSVCCGCAGRRADSHTRGGDCPAAVLCNRRRCRCRCRLPLQRRQAADSKGRGVVSNSQAEAVSVLRRQRTSGSAAGGARVFWLLSLRCGRQVCSCDAP